MRCCQNVVANLVVQRLRDDADCVTTHAADASAAAVQPVGNVVAEVALQRVLVGSFPELEPVAGLARIGVSSRRVVGACVIERPCRVLSCKLRVPAVCDIEVNALPQAHCNSALVLGIVEVRWQIVLPTERQHRRFAGLVGHLALACVAGRICLPGH